jgi:hypothetical protein
VDTIVLLVEVIRDISQGINKFRFIKLFKPPFLMVFYFLQESLMGNDEFLKKAKFFPLIINGKPYPISDTTNLTLTKFFTLHY